MKAYNISIYQENPYVAIYVRGSKVSCAPYHIHVWNSANQNKDKIYNIASFTNIILINTHI
jgi:hypothetical protein